ncbi:suppressor of fused domain protein [Nonomuraea mesophila]|uniref:Suppressor of fused domain protein n=1 Tax=Nonomuraea mesophila TaxID=2530382 RepID=A0A4R5FH01_9ACTN|nr:suppressor of fused domain protein [Nonomuraea mesophila]TDE50916.1 suppressor of fused domain protein [Nonomuraea mesophila]
MIETAQPTNGWDAINAALREHYGRDSRWPDWATQRPYNLGGPDPLDAIRNYDHDEPRPHWHMVGCGLSELYDKTSDIPDLSGWGIEFSLRVARDTEDAGPPIWAAVLLQQLARYVIAERPFAPGHTIHVASGIFNDRPGQAENTPTELAALAFAVDPDLGTIETPNGSVTFLQIAALTEAEYAAARGGNALTVLSRIEQDVPLHIVDRTRRSTL